MDLTQELLQKAKKAESAQALRALAKENGWEMTQEKAQDYYERIHNQGELSDEELENVTGGGCFNSKPQPKLIRNERNNCEHWKCKYDGMTRWNVDHIWKTAQCARCGQRAACFNCCYVEVKGKSYYCNFGMPK